MAQDAQLISQAGLVESLASDGLVSVSTGAGQPQKNMELAKFADSLGSSVPLQQNAEQVGITGLYARTSDGKMVELTKESVAQVMAGLMGNPLGYQPRLTAADDLNNVKSGMYYTGGTENPKNCPDVYNNCIIQYNNSFSGGRSQILFSTDARQTFVRTFNSVEWAPWTRIDNFGYNSLAELSSGVAEQIGVKSLSGVITVNSGEEKEILPAFCFGIIIINNTNTGKTTIIASDSQVLTNESVLYDKIGIGLDLSSTSGLCVNRKSTNGAIYLKNNTSSGCNILARCVSA